MVVRDAPTAAERPSHDGVPVLRAPDAVPPVDDHVFLLGRPTLRQFVAFVHDVSIHGQRAESRALAHQWRTVRDEWARRARNEAGAADGVTVLPLPDELEPLREGCLAQPLLRHAFDTVPVDVGWVELDRLVVYQKHIDLAYVARVRDRLGDAPSREHVFRTCLSYETAPPPLRAMRTRDNTYVIVSPSNDLRALGGSVLEPQQIHDHHPPGVLGALVGVGIGFGSNLLTAVQAEGRLVLCNGSHRAYALRQMGHTHAPCLIQQVQNRDELLSVASSDLRRDPDAYLRHPRPPLLRDYFDDRLCRLIPCVRRVRQVRIRFDVEEVDVPAV